ncbi:MAG: pyruvate kinase [Clostridiales bacterium]
MEYKIIATLGPASNSETIWSKMISAGASSFRLNCSHLEISELKRWLERIAEFNNRSDNKIPVVLDLQGSKWRLGNFPTRILSKGQIIKLDCCSRSDDMGILPVPHADFFEAASVSDKEIRLSDAKVILQLLTYSKDEITAKVIKAGEISSRKGITYSSTGYRKEVISEKDSEIIDCSICYDFIQYAVSYIKDSAEMSFYREHIGTESYIIAKLERESAIKEAFSIAKSSDELWICRGDLGAELGIKQMAIKVSDIAEEIKNFSKPVIMAGQVLEHMTRNSSATRSEICYIYDCLLKGYKGFVLSDECAIGKFPVESCKAASIFK